MNFRKAVVADTKDVCEVIEDGRASLKELGIDQWQASSPNRAIIEADIACDQGFVVTDDNGGIMGYMMLSDVGDVLYDDIVGGVWLTDSDSADARYLSVHRVAVRKEARGSGVGRFMLEKAQMVASACGLDSVRIDTHEGNTVMRRLLESLGFTQCGTVLMPPGAEFTRERIAYEKLV